MTADPIARPINPQVRIGHVHLKVADLERAVGFYRDVLGFALTQRFGTQAAFLSAGGYHHHIGLNTWESRGGKAPPHGTTGLYHVAILYPDRATLADALRRLIKNKIPLDGASDHGVSEALYLTDPDRRGVAEASLEMYQLELAAAHYGEITTEIIDGPTFYYAEDYHQQYLAKNPGGYCGLGGTGVSCPIGLVR